MTTFEWARGEIITRRDIHAGRPWYGVASVVVDDRDGRLITYMPPGSECATPIGGRPGLVEELARGEWELGTTVRFNHTLGFSRGGQSHAVMMFWDEAWEFLGWYVNLEAPMRRTVIGFDTCDYHLDVVIAPDGKSWAWKDEDHMALAVSSGLFSPTEVDALRSEAMEVVARCEKSDEPFTSEWVGWRPDPAWPIPKLPAGWEQLPTR
jgi:hypothetical protein